MPLSVLAGMAEKKASNAASPPAEAPIPTMGKYGSGETSWSAVASAVVVGPDSTIPDGASTGSSGGVTAGSFGGDFLLLFIVFLL